jgi:type I restriction enzyme S subunit
MTDFNNKTIDELIDYCKSKNINYFTKTNKPMSKKTILSNLKKLGLIEDIDDGELNIETEDIDLIIKICHNYLYKSSGIVGSKAQNDIMRILILRIFNILISKNNEYLLSILNDDNLTPSKFPKLKKEKIEKYKSFLYDINNFIDSDIDIRNTWSNFIPEFMYKLFPNIYSKDDSIFNTPNEYDIKKLIQIISKLKITDDFINDFAMKNGDIHESFLKYQGNVNSKELGQFFTPRIIIKSLLNECGFKDLILNMDGSNLSLYDPCMGTGGLLCYTYNYCRDKIDVSKIYGCDIEKDTIKFGSASLMLATNQYNYNIVRCNALVENPYLLKEDKFDIIIINPPFGTKNKHKDLKKLFNNYKGDNQIDFNNIYPIESNIGAALFIQMVIYSLKLGGIVCIILPDGELMTSIGSYNIRKFILDKCQLLKVINIQGGSFTNTGIKTKALFLKKGDYDNYNQDVEFIELNQEIKVLGIKKLNENLQFTFEDEKEEIINYNEDIEIKTLGEVCEFQNGYSFKSTDYEKQNNTNIGIVQIKSIQNGFIDTKKITEYIKEDKKYTLFEIQEGNILIGLTGSFKIGIYNLKQKSYLNQRVAIINAKNGINQKYIYYWYICFNIEKYILENLATGVAQPNISTNDISLIKIPIPSLEKQNEIVEYLDFIYEKSIKSSNEKIEDIKKVNKYYLNLNIKFNKEIEIKTLGNVCEFLPKTKKLQAKDGLITGLYNFYTSSQNKLLFINECEYNDYSIIIGRGGSASIHYDKKFSISHDDVYVIKNTNININLKFIYYYLKLNINLLQNGFNGAVIKHISKEYLNLIKIPIPSIEKQIKIVEYLDFNNDLIKNLEKEIEINKIAANDFMKMALCK